MTTLLKLYHGFLFKKDVLYVMVVGNTAANKAIYIQNIITKEEHDCTHRIGRICLQLPIRYMLKRTKT